jgi:prevent-host-death family protein
MGRTLSASQAKAQLADCLRKAEHGEAVIITRHGKAVAALVAVDRVSRLGRKDVHAGAGRNAMCVGPQPGRALPMLVKRRFVGCEEPRSTWPDFLTPSPGRGDQVLVQAANPATP